jgi:hypothetical protein
MIFCDPFVTSTIGAKFFTKRQVDVKTDLTVLIEVGLPNSIFPDLFRQTAKIPVRNCGITGIPGERHIVLLQEGSQVVLHHSVI